MGDSRGGEASVNRLFLTFGAAVTLCLGAAQADEIAPLPMPFAVGEKLTYAIRYKFITAGMATMEIKDIRIGLFVWFLTSILLLRHLKRTKQRSSNP